MNSLNPYNSINCLSKYCASETLACSERSGSILYVAPPATPNRYIFPFVYRCIALVIRSLYSLQTSSISDFRISIYRVISSGGFVAAQAPFTSVYGVRNGCGSRLGDTYHQKSSRLFLLKKLGIHKQGTRDLKSISYSFVLDLLIAPNASSA